MMYLSGEVREPIGRSASGSRYCSLAAKRVINHHHPRSNAPVVVPTEIMSAINLVFLTENRFRTDADAAGCCRLADNVD